MITYERTRSLLDSGYAKSGLNVPELAEAIRILEYVRRDATAGLQRAQEQLRAQVTALQARNKDLEAYAYMVAHDLKDPLAVMVVTADLITDIPDLTRQKLKEYLEQIKSTAYEMNGIITNLLLFTELTRAEAPITPVDLASVVANVLDRLSHLIKEKPGSDRPPAGLAGGHRVRTLDRGSLAQLPQQCHQTWGTAAAR